MKWESHVLLVDSQMVSLRNLTLQQASLKVNEKTLWLEKKNLNDEKQTKKKKQLKDKKQKNIEHTQY